MQRHVRATGFAPLVAVVALSLAMNTWRLGETGYGNTYYAAAVRSMTLSWSNFFFGAFDPGGFITVDKPPVFLWFGAASARLFGYSTWALLLPSAIAGAATVGLLWVIVRRHFGTAAATIAALALAFSPITVAVDRLNLPEPFMTLALVAAAAAVLCSLESRRGWAWAATAGFLVGVAFNTKMLAAWIPGPAFALAILVGWGGPWRTALRPVAGRLAVLAVVTLLTSASWMAVVDRIPEGSRPYIGGSTDNTVQDLVLGYNGFGRVDGEDQGRGRNRGNQPPPVAPGARPGAPAPGAVPPNPPGGAAGPAGPPAGPSPAAPGTFNGPGGIIAGEPGLWRMFDAANGGQIGWLLPFALAGMVWSGWLWRRDPVRRAAVALFAGWMLLHAGIFSFAQGIYHSYYTASMAPGVAAMAGIGGVAAVEVVRRHRAWLVTVGLAVLATVLVQLEVASRQPEYFGWLRPHMVDLTVLGAGLLVIAAVWRRVSLEAGMAVVLAALLLLPGAWSFSEASQASLNATLPQAGPRQGAAGRTFGSRPFDDGTEALARWLAAQGDSAARWDLAVASAQVGSPLIARHSLSVIALGGFSGRDPAITVEEFAGYVARGDVRFVSVEAAPNARAPGPGQPPAGRAPQPPQPPPGAPGRAPAGSPPTGPGARPQPQPAPPPGPIPGAGVQSVMTAVRATCVPVRDPALPPRFQGVLYDCAGKGEALARGR